MTPTVSRRVHVLREVMSLLTRHRELTWEMAKRDLSERYAGQWLGIVWVVAHPLLVMIIYVVIFAFVLKVQLDESQAFPGDYATYILSGLIPWMAFQDSMSKSCGAVTGHRALVKQIVFPVEVLPVKVVLAACVTQATALVALAGYVFFTHRAMPVTYGLLPFLFFFQILAMVGMSYLLSAVAVYVRDMKDIIQVFGMVGVYLMPIFYLPQWVPHALQPILYFNPFSYMVWCYQDALYFGRVDHPWAWLVFGALSVVLFLSGYRLFTHLKTWFGSAL
jgi:lipopolysaccharide transport system permease protein